MLKRPLISACLVLALILTALAQKGGSNSQADRRRGGEQITEITLERTACFGTCPMYKVTLKADGTFTYEGKEYVEHKGRYKGRFYGFNRLAQLVEKYGYFSMKDDYSVSMTDLPSTITSVVRNGRRKRITNYGDSGPLELWAIEQAVDGVLANAKFEKAADK